MCTHLKGGIALGIELSGHCQLSRELWQAFHYAEIVSSRFKKGVIQDLSNYYSFSGIELISENQIKRISQFYHLTRLAEILIGFTAARNLYRQQLNSIRLRPVIFLENSNSVRLLELEEIIPKLNEPLSQKQISSLTTEYNKKKLLNIASLKAPFEWNLKTETKEEEDALLLELKDYACQYDENTYQSAYDYHFYNVDYISKRKEALETQHSILQKRFEEIKTILESCDENKRQMIVNLVYLNYETLEIHLDTRCIETANKNIDADWMIKSKTFIKINDFKRFVDNISTDDLMTLRLRGEEPSKGSTNFVESFMKKSVKNSNDTEIALDNLFCIPLRAVENTIEQNIVMFNNVLEKEKQYLNSVKFYLESLTITVD